MLQLVKQIEASLGFTFTEPPLDSINRSCNVAAAGCSGNLQLPRDKNLMLWALDTSCAESTAANAVHQIAAEVGTSGTDESYAACKVPGGSATYMRQWCRLRKCDMFQQWINKPQSFENFTLM